MRKAIIDIGTNSIRLIVADCQEQVQVCYSAIEITRIGEGMGSEHILKPEPLARTCQVAAEYAQKARAMEAEIIKMTATSAIREARNQLVAAQALMEAAQVPLTILSGTQEAELSYKGAALDFQKAGQALAVLDIGGGSTELVYESPEGLSKASVAVGAVRLQEDAALVAQLPILLQPLLTKALPKPLTLVGVGGTITSLAAMDQQLAVYSQERVHGYLLSAAAVQKWLDRLQGMPLAERQTLPGLMPKRADIIDQGALILQVVLSLLQQTELIVSDKDLLYGLLAEDEY